MLRRLTRRVARRATQAKWSGAAVDSVELVGGQCRWVSRWQRTTLNHSHTTLRSFTQLNTSNSTNISSTGESDELAWLTADVLEQMHAAPDDWQPIIGLECHAQVNCQTKAFSRAGSEAFSGAPFTHMPNEGNDAYDGCDFTPNQAVSLFDAAMPGTLPVPSDTYVLQAVRLAHALGCNIHGLSRWERKHYHYPDLPHGYQLTQQRWPIASNGRIAFRGTNRVVGLDRVQLEHDSGKSVHDVFPGKSLVDLNRAGVALLEIVTLPHLHSAQETVACLKELQVLLRHCAISEARMDAGEFRCDVNINVVHSAWPAGVTAGHRVELKNMNSMRAVMRGILYETRRQRALWMEGQPVQRETRNYDVSSDSSVRLRDKESLHDYRFMACPNLLPLRLEPDFVEFARSTVPMLPTELFERYTQELDLSPQQANTILNTPHACEYFETLLQGPAGGQKDRSPKTCAQWFGVELIGRLRKAQRAGFSGVLDDGDEGSDDEAVQGNTAVSDDPILAALGMVGETAAGAPADSEEAGGGVLDLRQSPVQAKRLGALIDMVDDERISALVAKKVLFLMLNGDDRSPAAIVEERGWIMKRAADSSGDDELHALCADMLERHPEECAKYHAKKSHKHKIAGFLIGKLLKESSHTLHPPSVAKTINKMLAAQQVPGDGEE